MKQPNFVIQGLLAMLDNAQQIELRHKRISGKHSEEWLSIYGQRILDLTEAIDVLTEHINAKAEGNMSLEDE